MGTAGYTSGQRKGLPPSPSGARMYVIDIDAADNTVVIGPEEKLLAHGLRASGATFLGSDWSDHDGPRRVTAKVRYKSPEMLAHAIPLAGDAFTLRFDEPQRAVTPGQAVVLYDGERMLGGGVIDAAITDDSFDHSEAPTGALQPL